MNVSREDLEKTLNWYKECFTNLDTRDDSDEVKIVYKVLQEKLDEVSADNAHTIQDRINDAYTERNKVVACLAKCFPSGIRKTAIEGWDEAWHNCCFIDLPTGQASWHYHDDDAYIFDWLPVYTKDWDGHSTPEKYDRLAKLEIQPNYKKLAEDMYNNAIKIKNMAIIDMNDTFNSNHQFISADVGSMIIEYACNSVSNYENAIKESK